MTVRHPGARRMLAAIGLPAILGLPDLPDWLGDGSFSLVAHGHGAASQVSADNFDLTAGSVRLDGRFLLDFAGNEPRLAAQLHTAAGLEIPLPSAASTVPLPIDLLHGWQGDIALNADDLTVGIRTEPTQASLRPCFGWRSTDRTADRQIGGGTLAVSGLFDGAANPPSLVVQAELQAADHRCSARRST